jgi:hypothetical protein
MGHLGFALHWHRVHRMAPIAATLDRRRDPLIVDCPVAAASRHGIEFNNGICHGCA